MTDEPTNKAMPGVGSVVVELVCYVIVFEY